jgi:hypothetical protein
MVSCVGAFNGGILGEGATFEEAFARAKAHRQALREIDRETVRLLRHGERKRQLGGPGRLRSSGGERSNGSQP